MKRKTVAIVLSFSMMSGMLAGCGGAGKAEEAITQAETTEAKNTQGENTQEENTQEDTSSTRMVTDSDGNEVEIPKDVTAVAPSIGAFAQVTEMLLNGKGKITAAATQQISDDFKSVFQDYTASNPDNYDASSVEDLIASGTQVVYGPKSAYTDEQIQQMEQAGIAFVNISNLSDSKSIMESFKLIGEILGDEEAERAEKFCDYYQESIDDCQLRIKDLGDSHKVKVLRLGVNGGTYSTVNKTDIFHSIVEEAGGVNVSADYEVSEKENGGQGAPRGQADRKQGDQKREGQNQQGSQNQQSGQDKRGNQNQQGGQGQQGGGRAGLTVDAEQILQWDPEVIITMSNEAVEEIKNDPALADVTAVKNGAVYNTPQGLYMWGVRSGENAMMTPWLGQILYPDLYEDIDMKQIVKDFYADWYNTELDDAGAEAVLAGK